jgi:hypothetical protein
MGGGEGSCGAKGRTFVVIGMPASAPKFGKMGAGGMAVVKL